MATLNKVFLIGNLTRDPELKYITSHVPPCNGRTDGVGVTKFGLAVNRIYNSPDGEKKEDTCFVDVVVWDKLAEVCAEHLRKVDWFSSKAGYSTSRGRMMTALCQARGGRTERPVPRQ